MEGKSQAESQLLRKPTVPESYFARSGFPGPPRSDHGDVLDEVYAAVEKNEQYAQQNRLQPDSYKRFQIVEEATSARVFMCCVVIGFITAALYQNLK